MTVLVATSVVRGTRQGESHGGVYLIDLEKQRAKQTIDWNTADIDWQGRGWDRGLRGIAFDGDRVFIAASDELFEYDKSFNLKGFVQDALSQALPRDLSLQETLVSHLNGSRRDPRF